MTQRTALILGVGGCLGALAAGGLIIVLAAWFFVPSNALDNRLPSRQTEMWDLTREWGSLPDLPSDASSFAIETSGSSFTRTFESRFTAPAPSLQSWLEAISWLPAAESQALPGGGREYSHPGFEGASRCTIRVDATGTEVTIRVSWS